jgi:hypothetical protein
MSFGRIVTLVALCKEADSSAPWPHNDALGAKDAGCVTLQERR